jgi:8-oxo-dGTP pyrophosphatase MutT (NUDIX family)
MSDSKRPLDSSPKLLAWKQQVTDAGCMVRGIKPLHILHKKNGSLLFALLKADVISAEGTRLPDIIFIRGDACLIVPLIRNRDTGEERFLMVRQRRIGSGMMSLEFPAGMLDDETGNPRGVAARELAEETGIEVPENGLFPLCRRKLFSSVGASDEGIFYYGCICDLDDTAYRALSGRPGGNPDEQEHIQVALMTREEAINEASSGQVRLGLYLFEEYRNRHGT